MIDDEEPVCLQLMVLFFLAGRALEEGKKGSFFKKSLRILDQTR